MSGPLFSCRICGREGGSFPDPITHFEDAHPGHLDVVTIGDIWNQTMLVRGSSRGLPKREDRTPAEQGEDQELPITV